MAEEQEYDPQSIQDDDEVRRLYLEDWLGERGYDVYGLVSDPTICPAFTLREWLRDHGFDPDEILVFDSTNVTASRAPGPRSSGR